MAGLSFQDVTHAYDGVEALRSFDLEVRDGEIVCLVGPSGCGKTTALRLAAGLEPLSHGNILVGGEHVSGGGRDWAPEERGVGLVFQDFALFPHMRVKDNIAFGLKGLDRATRQARVGELLEQVGLPGYGRKYPHMLSGGEQQRVALARALAPRPPVLLLDEPFSGLDVRLREEVRDLTLRILRDVGAAALVVTHDAEEAMYMGDRIAVMQEARLVQVGKPSEIYRNPASAFVAKFLGEVNWLHGIVTNGVVDSPIGRVDAGDIGEGEQVDVLVRPEGLKLCSEAHAVGRGAWVIANHPLGYVSLVTLRLDDGNELRARITGQDVPSPGQDVKIRFEPDAVFVFPCRADHERNQPLSG
ncbi:MAG: ABC transporter ATP-binding protein [Rhodospirillaceae bacterium]|nr:ABC transporter ATP-binding protein [Rhodospirillaceae bacterium]|tara:strand:+ start:17562 stop:18635 length:1074 start_codon:yes stop_codon:yes gene_type:complete